eukprot:5904686-Alexandrium_andersonii.AAC.1
MAWCRAGGPQGLRPRLLLSARAAWLAAPPQPTRAGASVRPGLGRSRAPLLLPLRGTRRFPAHRHRTWRAGLPRGPAAP